MTRKTPPRSAILLFAATAAAALALAPLAAAGKTGGGCTPAAPTVSIENAWGWGAWGSWGTPGQTLAYQIHLVNNDAGCAASNFVISMTAPSGFTVSIPTSAVSVKSWSSVYLWAYVKSPSAVADGDYPLTVTAQRGSSPGSTVSFTSAYKVYSTDTIGPTLFWPNPGEGQTLSGRSYNVVVSSNDDHAVKRIEIYIDDVYRSTTTCDDVAYNCSAAYKWSLRGVTGGRHVATFRSIDWFENPGVLTVNFTVS